MDSRRLSSGLLKLIHLALVYVIFGTGHWRASRLILCWFLDGGLSCRCSQYIILYHNGEYLVLGEVGGLILGGED